MTAWTLAEELAQENPNTARGALLAAQAVAYPRLDSGYYLALLDQLARDSMPHVPPLDPPLHRALLLSEVLFGPAGWRGNKDAYDDPRNSFLNEVLERRLGLPITLSILYIDVARRLDIPAYGVGLPGHFIVGVDDGREQWYLDPFNGGGRLSQSACAGLVEYTTGYAGPFRAAWLQPVPPRAIIARLLNNLRVITVRRHDWAYALRVVQQLRLVQPDQPEHLRDMGLLHHHLGSPLLSARYLDAYLRRAPDAPDADTLRAGMSEALDAWARLN